MHCTISGARLAPDDNVARLAEGLRRLYGEKACQQLRQFASENAKAGDAFSAAYWEKIAHIISNAQDRQTPSAGREDFDGASN